MDEGKQAVNPQLSDIFRTAIESAKPRDRQIPQITVHGDHNVFALGGTIYVTGAIPERRRD